MRRVLQPRAMQLRWWRRWAWRHGTASLPRSTLSGSIQHRFSACQPDMIALECSISSTRLRAPGQGCYIRCLSKRGAGPLPRMQVRPCHVHSKPIPNQCVRTIKRSLSPCRKAGSIQKSARNAETMDRRRCATPQFTCGRASLSTRRERCARSCRGSWTSVSLLLPAVERRLGSLHHDALASSSARCRTRRASAQNLSQALPLTLPISDVRHTGTCTLLPPAWRLRHA